LNNVKSKPYLSNVSFPAQMKHEKHTGFLERRLFAS